MGYTTKFSGEFKLDRPLDDETYEELAAMDGPFYGNEQGVARLGQSRPREKETPRPVSRCAAANRGRGTRS